jgi:hypothetical protein
MPGVGSLLEHAMSVFGTKRTCRHVRYESDLHPIADIINRKQNRGDAGDRSLSVTVPKFPQKFPDIDPSEIRAPGIRHTHFKTPLTLQHGITRKTESFQRLTPHETGKIAILLSAGNVHFFCLQNTRYAPSAVRLQHYISL